MSGSIAMCAAGKSRRTTCRYGLTSTSRRREIRGPNRAAVLFSPCAADARALGAGPQGLKSTAARFGPRISRRLEVEVSPYRHVVRWLFPAAHIAIDPDIDQAIAGLRRQQQMIDPQTLVFLPGTGLVI